MELNEVIYLAPTLGEVQDRFPRRENEPLQGYDRRIARLHASLKAYEGALAKAPSADTTEREGLPVANRL